MDNTLTASVLLTGITLLFDHWQHWWSWIFSASWHFVLSLAGMVLAWSVFLVICDFCLHLWIALVGELLEELVG